MRKNYQKMAMLGEKCTFCNLQNCHFVCHFFVIWWKIYHFFGHCGAIFSEIWPNIEICLQNVRKIRQNDKQNGRPKPK